MSRREQRQHAELDSLQESGHALLSLDGMWCPSCSAATEQLIRRTPGVLEVGVSFTTSAALVRWDPQRLNLRDLARRVERLGYRLRPAVGAEEALEHIDHHVEWLGIRLAVASFFGMWAMLLSILRYLDIGFATSSTAWWFSLVAGVSALPVVVFTGGPILLAGWRTLRLGVPGMDTLVALGTIAALGLSTWQLVRGVPDVYFDTAVMLVTLLTIGRFIETRTLRHATQAINALHDTLPETAERLSADGVFHQIPANQVAVGSVIRVDAGQRIPLDGYILQGTSQLDKSVLTGESLPVTVAANEPVEAGCINLSSPLTVYVVKGVGQRHVDRIGARIAEAAGAKGGTQQLADAVARWVVPVALSLATVTWIVSWSLGFPAEEAVLRAISVLVVACPCAVGIAIPIAYVSAASHAARHGILFRHPASLENMAQVDTIMFDKTGTLTEGQLSVVDVHIHRYCPDFPYSREFILALAARAERGVEHPISHALQQAAGDDIFASGPSTSSPQRHDRGVCLEDPDWGTLLVGSRDFLSQYGVSCEHTQFSRDSLPSSELSIEVAAAGTWLATITLQDRIRNDAACAVQRLHDFGIVCLIVTGDRVESAEHVAEKLGIPSRYVFAGRTPEGKAAIVDHVHSKTAFAGDGINDGPALASADVGIAVASATNAATAAASIAVTRGGVAVIVDSLIIARKAFRVMRQNLAYALCYNAFGLTLAAFGVIPPVFAALAMAASSLTVIANTTRIATAHSLGRFD